MRGHFEGLQRQESDTMKDKNTNASRVTNGSALHFDGGDGRSGAARRWRDLFERITKETLAQGRKTEAARQLVRRATMLAFLAERMEGAVVRGEPIDEGNYVRIAGALSRCYVALGLQPDVTGDNADTGPSLVEYLASREATAE